VLRLAVTLTLVVDEPAIADDEYVNYIAVDDSIAMMMMVMMMMMMMMHESREIVSMLYAYQMSRNDYGVNNLYEVKQAEEVSPLVDYYADV
jgi:hypothetical protein